MNENVVLLKMYACIASRMACVQCPCLLGIEIVMSMFLSHSELHAIVFSNHWKQ